MQKYILLALLIWNLIVFIMYGLDKYFAKHQYRRISEFTLLITALIFASPGALLGMLIFHHKTRKVKFLILIPLFFVLHVLAAYWAFFVK